jgi:hypothetical protein
MPIYQYRDTKTGRTVEFQRAVAERDAVDAGLVRITVPERVVCFGLSSDKPEPGSAVDAVPRAFRQLEQTMPAREIVKESGFSVETVKRVWGM